MATRIVFGGGEGESILVAEELDTVVQGLEGHAPDTPALPRFTDADGRPVHVRPASVLYVTSA